MASRALASSAVRASSALPAGPATRSAQLAEKMTLARTLQRRLAPESREAQLLAIAVLRRDEALLDELIRRVG